MCDRGGFKLFSYQEHDNPNVSFEQINCDTIMQVMHAKSCGTLLIRERRITFDFLCDRMLLFRVTNASGILMCFSS